MHGGMRHDGHQSGQLVDGVGLRLVAHVICVCFQRIQVGGRRRPEDEALVVLSHPPNAAAASNDAVAAWRSTSANPRGDHAVFEGEQFGDVDGFVHLNTRRHGEHQATSPSMRPISGRWRSTA